MSLSLDIEVRRSEETGIYKIFDISPAYTDESLTHVTTSIDSDTSYSFSGGSYLTMLYSLDDFTLTKSTSGSSDVFETKLLVLDGDQSLNTFTCSTTGSDEIILYMFKS
jgi:hypothetical protein